MTTVAEMVDKYEPHLVFLQETKLHKIRETEVANKFGSDRVFILNSNDQYETDFGDKLSANSKQAYHGTGLIVNTETAGKNFTLSDPVTARIQHLKLNNINYINVYLP